MNHNKVPDDVPETSPTLDSEATPTPAEPVANLGHSAVHRAQTLEDQAEAANYAVYGDRLTSFL